MYPWPWDRTCGNPPQVHHTSGSVRLSPSCSQDQIHNCPSFPFIFARHEAPQIKSDILAAPEIAAGAGGGSRRKPSCWKSAAPNTPTEDVHARARAHSHFNADAHGRPLTYTSCTCTYLVIYMNNHTLTRMHTNTQAKALSRSNLQRGKTINITFKKNENDPRFLGKWPAWTPHVVPNMKRINIEKWSWNKLFSHDYLIFPWAFNQQSEFNASFIQDKVVNCIMQHKLAMIGSESYFT